MSREHFHFVTGRLAEHALRGVLAELSERVGFDYSIDVLPITVAALMTPAWIARHLTTPPEANRVIVPGYCDGDLSVLQETAGVTVERGPRDLRRLAEYFGHSAAEEDYGRHEIQIVAEINHAPRLSLPEFLAAADQLAAEGADLIDVGCEPGSSWGDVSTYVRALIDRGLRASIDSLNPREIAPAVEAGAELVLSVNASNRDAAADWGCEVVVIPDEFSTLGGLDETLEQLSTAGVPVRIDPILEPIGCGFAASLGRYLEVRRRYPDVEMMMGIGNLTELTDCDSAGINTLLLGFCQELSIRSVLTTQVINWARTSVKECDRARRLVYWAQQQQVPPKHREPDLVMLRDPRVDGFGDRQLDMLAAQIKDNNFRIFAEEDEVHLISAGLHLRGPDPFLVFDQLLTWDEQRQAAGTRSNLDASHAFYLGYEMAKAVTALTLSKQYTQDEALRWGLLTREEQSHRLQKSRASKGSSQGDGKGASNGKRGSDDASG